MLIEEIGKALWGERWQAEMARALDVHRDTVQDWSKKQYEFRPEVVEKLRLLLGERREELEMLEDQLTVDGDVKVSCPECGGRLLHHRSVFDGSLYECRKHGFFGVSGTAEACGFWNRDKRTRSEAFRLAQARGSKNKGARNDPRPATLITSYDF